MEDRIGKLTKVASGRWAIRYDNDYDEITSDDVFEIQVLGVWHTVRMGSSNGEYYATPKVPLKEGLAARNNTGRF